MGQVPLVLNLTAGQVPKEITAWPVVAVLGQLQLPRVPSSAPAALSAKMLAGLWKIAGTLVTDPLLHGDQALQAVAVSGPRHLLDALFQGLRLRMLVRLFVAFMSMIVEGLVRRGLLHQDK